MLKFMKISKFPKVFMNTQQLFKKKYPGTANTCLLKFIFMSLSVAGTQRLLSELGQSYLGSIQILKKQQLQSWKVYAISHNELKTTFLFVNCFYKWARWSKCITKNENTRYIYLAFHKGGFFKSNTTKFTLLILGINSKFPWISLIKE